MSLSSCIAHLLHPFTVLVKLENQGPKTLSIFEYDGTIRKFTIYSATFLTGAITFSLLSTPAVITSLALAVFASAGAFYISTAFFKGQQSVVEQAENKQPEHLILIQKEKNKEQKAKKLILLKMQQQALSDLYESTIRLQQGKLQSLEKELQYLKDKYQDQEGRVKLFNQTTINVIEDDPLGTTKQLQKIKEAKQSGQATIDFMEKKGEIESDPIQENLKAIDRKKKLIAQLIQKHENELELAKDQIQLQHTLFILNNKSN